MSKELHINTPGPGGHQVRTATGSFATPLHFSTTYQHPESGRPTGFLDSPSTSKTKLVVRQSWRLLSQQTGAL